MDACGLIVEYNPFHNGHLYHIQEAKKVTNSTCIIAIMSGSFLQRGEPAIIDKFHRAKAALSSGVDIVLELPYPYAVQSSNLFAKGAIRTLNEIGVSSICFGSESGKITDFINSYDILKANKIVYQHTLKMYLNEGHSYPKANEYALQENGLKNDALDLSKPNNILGFSYVSTVLENNFPIDLYTIKRTSNDFHEQKITNPIASATSIRKQLLTQHHISLETEQSVPIETIKQMTDYKKKSAIWHTWESYFPLLHYRVMTMSEAELKAIEGVDEGLEYRIKQTAPHATSFKQWMELIKTKRYTWTRLQRMFVHILTNTKKVDLLAFEELTQVPYIRLLGITKMGRSYLKKNKKKITVPVITQFSRNQHAMLTLEEQASNAYYSILEPLKQIKFRQQELEKLIMIEK